MAGTIRMKQIHLGLGSSGYLPIRRTHKVELNIYNSEHERHEAILLGKCPANLWPSSSYTQSCPRPILLDEQHRRQLLDLHGSLVLAITDIVNRWWSDKKAQFPQRMPLEEGEELLLQWLDGQVSKGNLAPYSAAHVGSWRPDFLVEDNGTDRENFRLTEINARFCFNGLMHGCYGQIALEEMGMKHAGLVGETPGTEFFDGLLRLFRRDTPLHLLKGEEKGIDITMFIHAVFVRLGVAPRLITPAELRLAVNPREPGKVKLCCLVRESDGFAPTFVTEDGDLVEEIHQVGLELHQRELAALHPEVLRQLSLRCFNDMRTILLVHDKRMLGIIKQELQTLVARRVLSQAQSVALDNGIADTFLAGSEELQDLLKTSISNPQIRTEYIMKPIRGGKGAGIVFGEDLTDKAWIAALQGLQTRKLAFGTSTVIQRRVKQHLYDVVLRKWGEVQQYALVGTYHAVHGRYLGIGIWRSSSERICAVSTGGAWFCSVMKDV